MNVFMLLKAELRRSAAVLAGLALVLALSLSLSIATGLTDRMLRQSSAAAADRFDLLIGAKGSSTSLLLSTVFLRDEPQTLVPLEVMKGLDDKHGVKWAAPVAFGDRADVSPIVGTTSTLVTFGGTLKPEEGRVFTNLFEAVVGAETDYKIGDKIEPMHGRTPGAGHKHSHAYFTVVGRMPATGTPWDRAVMVPIEALWSMHSLALQSKWQQNNPTLGEWSDEDIKLMPGVSAVVVKPISIADAYRLRQSQSMRTVTGQQGEAVNLMGVFSGEVLVSLYGLLGNASEAITLLARLTLFTALTATVIAGVLLGELRRPSLLQLRVLGAPRHYLITLIWLLIMTVIVVGAVGGLVLGTGFAEGAAILLGRETGIVMHPSPRFDEGMTVVITLIAGAFCALLPAWLVGRSAIR